MRQHAPREHRFPETAVGARLLPHLLGAAVPVAAAYGAVRKIEPSLRRLWRPFLNRDAPSYPSARYDHSFALLMLFLLAFSSVISPQYTNDCRSDCETVTRFAGARSGTAAAAAVAAVAAAAATDFSFR